MSDSKSLRSLLGNLVELSSAQNILVSDITFDSRLVKKGSLFLAALGEVNDGRRYIGDALAKGARLLSMRLIWIKTPGKIIQPTCLLSRFMNSRNS